MRPIDLVNKRSPDLDAVSFDVTNIAIQLMNAVEKNQELNLNDCIGQVTRLPYPHVVLEVDGVKAGLGDKGYLGSVASQYPDRIKVTKVLDDPRRYEWSTLEIKESCFITASHNDDPVSGLLWAKIILELTAFLDAEKRHPAHVKTQVVRRPAKRKHQEPPPPYKVIHIRGYAPPPGVPTLFPEDAGNTALHRVRGHWMRTPRSRHPRSWRRHHLRGNPERGTIKSDYKVDPS